MAVNFDEDTRRIMEHLDENQVAFSLQIANYLKVWFAEVEERLDLLVQRGYAEIYVGPLSGARMYSPTERCSRYLHGETTDGPNKPTGGHSFLGGILGRVIRRDYRSASI